MIQAAIAPVFLLSGVAAMLGVLTNRLARIVDRARALETRLEAHPESLPKLLGDLKVLARRARYINVAISLCTIAALLVALVVVTLFANAFLGVEADPRDRPALRGGHAVPERRLYRLLRRGPPGHRVAAHRRTPYLGPRGPEAAERAARGRICYPAHPFLDRS